MARCAHALPAASGSLATHYEMLRVSPEASHEMLREAFKRHVLSTHPDKGGSAESFHQLYHAYEVLSDPCQRQSYDLSIRNRAVPSKSLDLPKSSRTKRQRRSVESSLFQLLQQLPSAERRKIFQTLSPEQRRSLETSLQGVARSVSPPDSQVSTQANPSVEGEAGDATGADAGSEGARGIVTVKCGNGQAYMASVNFANLTISSPARRQFSDAVADLMLLTSMKQEVLSGSGDLGPRLREAAARVEQKSEGERLELAYVIRIRQSFWTGRTMLSTPRLKSADQAAWSLEQLEPHLVRSTGAAGHIFHLPLDELRSKWAKLQHAFADVCEKAGGDREQMLRRLQRLEAETEQHRQQLLRRYEIQRMRQEEALARQDPLAQVHALLARLERRGTKRPLRQ